MNEESALTNKKLTYVQKLYPLGFRHDAQKLGKMTLTFVFTYVLSLWLISNVSLAFMGYLGQTEFNASSLALTVYNLVSNTIMIGLTFSCNTLFPQCYGGNKRKMSIILQRAVIIAGYACFIVWSLLLNAVSAIRFRHLHVRNTSVSNHITTR